MARIAEFTISAIGAGGDGLGEVDGTRVYVPLTVPGDRVLVRLGAARGDGRAGDLDAILIPGPDRGTPPCRHFGVCGGCSLQHLGDRAYAEWKTARVRTALDRAGFADLPLAPLVRTEPGGRRRAVLVASRRGGRVSLGFHERRSHRVIGIESCPVLDPALVALLPALRVGLASVLVDGASLDAVATVLQGGIDLLLVGPAGLDLNARHALAELAEAADLARLSWQATPTAAIEPVSWRRPVTVRFGTTAVAAPPGAFLQASQSAEVALVAVAVSAVAGAQRIADLFAGCGAFTFPLAETGSVHAVDADRPGLAALAAAARGRPAITTEPRDLFRDPLTATELNHFDAVLFDPPRAGAAAQAAALANSRVPLVVAVSCNPASFARDARTLATGGYRPTTVVPVDQFLWSAQVELVAVFGR